MKKYSSILESKKKELTESELVNERNLYLEFSKKYNQEHGVSGPFDKKFKGDKKAQKDYMEGLSMAWDEYKKKKGIKIKDKKKFDFAKNESVNESKAFDMAKQMVNDGGDPNYHFVTMSDDYCYEKDGETFKYSKDVTSSPLKIKTTPNLGSYTFGPFLNLEESRMFAESVELDEINGPRMVVIQDRKNGDVYMKFLTCKLQPVWNEEVIDRSEEVSSGIEDSHLDDNPTTEYTYGNETEDEEE